MKKLLLVLTLAALFLFKAPTQTHAAFLPPSLYLGQTVPLYFEWQHSVKAYFIILNNVKHVSYMMTYTANDVPQGVTGSFNIDKKGSIMKSIYLGTCSTNSCVPHTGVENLKLDVTFTYNNNHIETKTYNVPTY